MDTMFTETNRTDLSVKEVINLYSKQWQIESNFKTLKGKLSLRPIVFINFETILLVTFVYVSFH